MTSTVDGQLRDEADGITPDMRAAYDTVVAHLERLTPRQRKWAIRELERKLQTTDPPPEGMDVEAARVLAMVGLKRDA